MRANGRLILLPGLGADSRLLAPQREAFPDLKVPVWIEPLPNEGLAEYAARLAPVLDIRPGDSLGGVSFGGMVALEMARLVPVHSVFLIASARSARSIRPAARWLGRAAVWLPAAAFRPRPWLRPAIAHAFGCVRAEETNLLLEMASALPPAFLHWGLGAILSWRPGTPLAVPVHHIHGDRDRLIPRRLVRPDRVIAGAGHLLNVTHAGAVNAFLQERLAAS